MRDLPSLGKPEERRVNISCVVVSLAEAACTSDQVTTRLDCDVVAKVDIQYRNLLGELECEE